jgi:hypothetical protein
MIMLEEGRESLLLRQMDKTLPWEEVFLGGKHFKFVL